MKNVVMSVSGGLRREIDSVNAIGLREVGGVDEESNVRNSDECTKTASVWRNLAQDCCEN